MQPPTRAAPLILVRVTIDPTHPAESGLDAPRTWTPDVPTADTHPAVPVPIGTAGAAVPAAPDGPFESHRPRRRPWATILLSALLVVALALAGYLWTTTRAYQARAVRNEDQARVIGTELAATRAELEGTTAELEGVRSQLETAQARIVALAAEKAQVGDDREAQRQLVDYQQRVSQAAGTVASALERCVQGQDQLITYLNDPSAYDPADLKQFGTEVDRLCLSATEANQALQDELSP